MAISGVAAVLALSWLTTAAAASVSVSQPGYEAAAVRSPPGYEAAAVRSPPEAMPFGSAPQALPDLSSVIPDLAALTVPTTFVLPIDLFVLVCACGGLLGPPSTITILPDRVIIEFVPRPVPVPIVGAAGMLAGGALLGLFARRRRTPAAA